MSDSAKTPLALPGALLQTLVAQQANAFTNKGSRSMASTTSPLSAGHTRTVLAPLLTSEVRLHNGKVVVALRGEADVSTRHELCDILSRAIARGPGDVLIDLTDVSFVDAATGRILASAQQLLKKDHRGLGFRTPPYSAQRVLHLFGMTDLIQA